jgi:hypothetical protein
MAHAPQAKGLQFRSFLRALERLRGEGAVSSTLALLPPDLADALRLHTIVTSGWYPLTWYRSMHAATLMATGEGLELTRAISRNAVQDDFRGVYRLIPMALSPQGIFRRAPLVAKLYYDTGTIHVTEAKPGVARGDFIGFRGFDEMLWADIIAGVLGVLELCGAKDLRDEVVSGGKDSPDMVLEVRWR